MFRHARSGGQGLVALLAALLDARGRLGGMTWKLATAMLSVMGLLACSTTGSARGESRHASIRVAGFVEAAGIT